MGKRKAENEKLYRASYLVNSYRKKDIKYGRETNITPQWIIDNVFSGQHCWYCGEWDWRKLGVDRVNNSIGHTVNNVVPCCRNCNDARGSKSITELLVGNSGLTRKILQIDKVTKEIIREWGSAMEAQREGGYEQSNVTKCCKGERKTSGGYIWRYAN